MFCMTVLFVSKNVAMARRGVMESVSLFTDGEPAQCILAIILKCRRF